MLDRGSVRIAGFAVFLLLLSGCPAPNSEEVSWVVMDTTASVKWQMNDGFSPQRSPRVVVREAFACVEKLLNAHDPSSELSRLATLPDEEILRQCSPKVRSCYAAAFRLRDQTGGVFNPRWRGVETMDLGAIAKGFAVDEAVRMWADENPQKSSRLLVDLGGNLKAFGAKGWKIGVRDGGAFMLESGQACATSGEYYRGKHIRDGRSGGVVTNGVYSVTVIHPTSAMLADGLSTTLFIMGREKGEAFLQKHYPEARAYWIISNSQIRSDRSH